MRGKKHSADSIEKMREAQARANTDPETRRRKSEAATKRNETMFTPEVRSKISKANSGENSHFYGKRFGRSLNPTPLREETKRKLSEAHRGKVLTDEHKAAIALGVIGKSSARGLNRRPVHVFQDGQHIASFLKLEFVAEDMGVSVKTMRNWLRAGKDFGDRRYVQDESTVSALRSKVR
jgi:hypothetical protein